ncbi:TonB-dependent receptor [Microbulbifer sp. OS29]|uniref:TonB-dependent receptor n=1 Tax=Microbulbifer okhotskensis TaxID=2926617 RepID=A0A9X2ENM0_9GAMM|nr:TonB-dependent receptor [Microbulbifer okhotskensis]MCO1332913.1 TonB-dependent receptor [Microbulbifer okhotskensis]
MKKKFSKNFLSAAILLATTGSSTVFAQENESSIEIADALEEVVVTGSRISRPNLTQPTPVTGLSAEDILNTGSMDLGSILSELPAVGATDTLQGNADRNADAGLSTADLRRLGSNRTLTLVDSRRHVGSSNGSVAVDLGTIPVGLIEKVEVVTGGASAVYGSDAVSGVVNIITKKNYEGIEINFTGDQSTEGVGSGNRGVNFLAGFNTADGKGNFTFYAAQEQIDEVMVDDLRHSDDYGTVVNPDNTGEEDGISDRIMVPRVYSEWIDENAVIWTPLGDFVFDNQGNPLPQQQRQYTNSGAFGNFPDGCDYCFELNDYENVFPSIKKDVFNTTFSYELTDTINFFSEVKYISSSIEQTYQPDFTFGGHSINVADNPYLDQDLREQLLAEDITSVSLAKFMADVPRNADNERELFRYVTGFNGEFELSETPINYELSYNYGRTVNTLRTTSAIIEGNFTAALDAVIDPETGEAACRNQVASAQGEDYQDSATTNSTTCAPYNPFGSNQASQESLDFISTPTINKTTIKQKVLSGFASFDSSEFLTLPGGPVGFAAGFEYREESSEQIVDSLAKQGLLSTAAVPDSFGEFDVTEGFLEVSLPILADLPGVESLVLDGAVRYADYSHAGSANAWKLGLMYSPIESVTFRATQSMAIRAPNIAEAYSPQQPGFTQINDPCDTDQIGDDADRAANCAALGIPSGFEASDNVSIEIISGGNPDLFAEESESYTAGVIWQPSFVEGLSLTVDYYNIEITDAITEVTAQTILDNCVDASGGPDSGFCSQVDRGTDNNVVLVRSGYINASALETSGFDISASYERPLSIAGLDGFLKTSVTANILEKLHEFEFQNRPDEVNYEDGEVGDPSWQFRWTTNYIYDDTSLGWTVRAFDEQARFDVSPNGESTEDTSPAYIDTTFYHDFNFSHKLTEKLAVNGGIRNVFDEEAPSYITGTGDDESMFDVIGRRVFLGVNMKI